jgi:putative ABC transport system substrate-binding protein
MNRKILSLVFIATLLATFLFLSDKRSKSQYVVGVILPMEHIALNQITQGIAEELALKMGKSVVVKVKNAQGDANIQRAIIEQLVREHCNLLIPVGTAASQMTLNLAPEQKILCLAADAKILQTNQKAQATALSDEISSLDSLTFLRSAFPALKKITLLYSAAEKVAKEIPLVCQAARELGIEVQKLMVVNMGELYTVSGSIASDSEAIFVLKDHLIVSGIQTVVQQAQMRKIPVMTSDEGSVIAGAAFAIGVKESSIGQQGALLAKAILEGESPQNMPPQTMRGPFPLFVNRTACEKQGINLNGLCAHAEKARINLHFVGS